MPRPQIQWLGTDDQGATWSRAMIYGFRISVLFRLTLDDLFVHHRYRGRRLQGYFGGWIDLIFQRVIEIWARSLTLFALDPLLGPVPGFFTLLGILLIFSWVRWWDWCAPNSSGRNFEYIQAARAFGVSNAVTWPAFTAERHGRDHGHSCRSSCRLS